MLAAGAWLQSSKAVNPCRPSCCCLATWLLSCSDVDPTDSLSAPGLFCDYPTNICFMRWPPCSSIWWGALQAGLAHSVLAAPFWLPVHLGI